VLSKAELPLLCYFNKSEIVLQVVEYNAVLQGVAHERGLPLLDLHGALAARLRQRVQPPPAFKPALARCASPCLLTRWCLRAGQKRE
jgi:hypothetical protein